MATFFFMGLKLGSNFNLGVSGRVLRLTTGAQEKKEIVRIKEIKNFKLINSSLSLFKNQT